MRGLAVLLVLCASVTALARPRVQVAPFSVRGATLAYFGPEVARAVEAALEGAGVETGAGAEATLTGVVEEREGDRVRLSATLRGRTLTAEGPLEAVDAVATQLANQIAPLLLENDPAAQKAAERRARDAARRAAAVPPSRPQRVARVDAAKPPPAKAAPAQEAPAAATASKPEAPPESPAAKPEAPVEPKPEAKLAEPVKPQTKSEPPDWVPPRVDVDSPPAPPPTTPPVAPPPPPYYGYVRGRVVAHTISDPQTGYPGPAGAMATQALFSFLHRRMRLSVIPTGVGVTSAVVAADEGYRAAARAVVMARLESVEYLPGSGARVRLEVVVVRDGRQVMRRVVESAPSDPNRRLSGADPIYQAVTMALEALVPELVGALADVR